MSQGLIHTDWINKEYRTIGQKYILIPIGSIIFSGNIVTTQELLWNQMNEIRNKSSTNTIKYT